jgi:hypothetical protein
MLQKDNASFLKAEKNAQKNLVELKHVQAIMNADTITLWKAFALHPCNIFEYLGC